MLPVAKQLYQGGVRDLPVIHNSGATPTQAKQIIGDPLLQRRDGQQLRFRGHFAGNLQNPATEQFYKDFLARYHEYPDDLTMWAYDTPFVLVAAMQKAGSVTDRQKIFAGDARHAVPRHDQRLDSGRGRQIVPWPRRPDPVGRHRLVPGHKTIGPVLLYFMDGLKVTQEKIVKNACKDR